jgi:hypothetical protein
LRQRRAQRLVLPLLGLELGAAHRRLVVERHDLALEIFYGDGVRCDARGQLVDLLARRRRTRGQLGRLVFVVLRALQPELRLVGEREQVVLGGVELGQLLGDREALCLE